MSEARGKFLYDVVSSNVAAQAVDQQALTGRAKDFIGLAAISSTITGAIANDKLFNVDKGALPVAFAVLLTIGVAITMAAGLFVLKPRSWFFATEASGMFTFVSENLDADVDEYYGAAARGFVNPGTISETKSAIQTNADQLKVLEVALFVQLFGVVVLALSGLSLAFAVLT